jgi:hypothetical protein
MNGLLLCHGRLSDFGSLTLDAGQTVQYRGNYGNPLSGTVARSLVQAILDNPHISDEEIGRSVERYQPQDPLQGPGGFKPDINLSGDDRLRCFFMDLSTRSWINLDSTWSSTLGNVCQSLRAPLWLNLLCCTTLTGEEIPRAAVDEKLRVKEWSQLLR